MLSLLIKSIAGVILCAWGYLDGVKYHLEAVKIREARSSKGHSRKFINLALGNDFYRLFYFFFVDRNYYVLMTSIIALFFMLEMFWQLYIYYPYKYRNLKNFKRPTLFLYIINSLIPNSIRKKL